MTIRRVLAFVAAILAVLAAVSGTSRPSGGAKVDVAALARDIEHEDDHVTAIELAEWIKDRKQGLRVLDIRSDSEFATFHIPSAERVPLSALASMKPNAN